MNLFGKPSSTTIDYGGGIVDDSTNKYQNVLALDQLKQIGMPIKSQLSPYLQIDPSIFKTSQPQYILPDGNENGKGMFEFALGHIGCAVGAGFFVGCARGFFGELFNSDTRKLTIKPWFTRVLNATGKHGSGYAQPAGSIVFLYSAVEMSLKLLRADDQLNSLAAGAIAGGLYRIPHSLRAAGVGSAVGLVLATLWNVGNPESRQRLREMFKFN